MNFVILLLALFLIVCAIATCIHKTLLTSIIIFMAYSTIMSLIWALLESPDLAITEAAVGAGVTSILFFVTLKKIRAIETTEIDPGSKDKDAALKEGIGAEYRG
jgi:uncharacterized MnhB-related membrane protein